MDKPHILILMPDQQRADCMSCAGHPTIKTPNMDRLAEQGTRFAQATTVSPICMPARTSFANGLYPHNHGMWANAGEMLDEDETFFQLLQQAGYFTAHVGKAHLYVHEQKTRDLRDREPYMQARGFDYVHETTGPHASCVTASAMTDEWQKKGLWQTFQEDYLERGKAQGGLVRPSPLPVEDYLDSYIGRQAAEFVDGYDESNPLCLFVGFAGPHEPWDAPGAYASLYDPADTPEPIPATALPDDCPDWLRGKRDFSTCPPEVLRQTPAIRANYYGKISLIDHWIGEILAAFAAKGWLDDLLVVFWSDHGEMVGDHGRLYKSTFHESSVRVPLVVRWPGKIPANTVSNALAEIIDVFPTLLEAAGCEPSRRCLGRSLWPALRDPGEQIRDFQLSEIDNGERHIMIRSRTRKYVVDDQCRGYMLYDLENDPHEQTNLIHDGRHAEMEAEMREALLQRVTEAQFSM